MIRTIFIITLFIMACPVLSQERDSIKVTDDPVYKNDIVAIDDMSYTDSNSGVGAYKDKLRSGEWKFYYTDKKLWKTGMFKAGLEEGEWKIYYRNGNLREVKHYSKGKRNGESTLYKENGKLHFQEHYKDDVLDGKATEYHDNGKIKETGTYEKWDKQGKWIGYSQSGIKQSEEIYENGKLGNNYNYYFEDGTLSEESSMDLSGKVIKIKYHKNGRVHMKVAGDKERMLEAAFFDNKGTALDSGTFKKGNGILNVYNEDGQLTKTIEFVNGKIK